MTTESTTATRSFQCRHIFADGRRCGSPCLRDEEFCYFHHTTRRPVANPRQRRRRRAAFDLPMPEDRSAIQSSIGEILRRIAANDIDPRRAGLLLYGLQIASSNLPRNSESARPCRSSHRHQTANTPEIVEEITQDPTHGPIAPRAQLTAPEQKPTSLQLFMQELTKSVPTEGTATEQKSQISPQPSLLPIVQAAATRRHRQRCASTSHALSPNPPSHSQSLPAERRMLRGN